MSEPHLSEPARRGRPPASAGAKVTVACKLPTGLTLNVCTMRTEQELVMGGGLRDVQRATIVGQIHLAGAGKKPNEAPKAPMAHGYALTYGVDKELFDRWLEDNKDSAYVRNKLVFAFEGASDVEACAKEHRDVRSNMEPLNGSDDPRMPKGGPLKIERATAA
jgi:hypothetical protein